MGKKETEEEKRKRLAMESIARLKSAMGSTKMASGGAAPSLAGVKGKGPREMEDDFKKRLPGGSSSKRTPSDDTADGIMSLWKKKRK